MIKKFKASGVPDTVWNIAAPIAEKLGLILWDVKYVKEGAGWYLRIIIDKENGVSLDDCIAMNDAMNDPLESIDCIEQSYNLQISSPGIERELVRDFHFASYLGAEVLVKFHAAVDGAKNHKCVLKGCENGKINLLFSDGEERSFDKKDIVYVKLNDFNENF